ncbi:MAG: sialic acid TRAP transporter substrate-binding protein SiaP [Burkholderiales bacterium]|nr:sialic acid TRAP transporter substrate-binding protein SiaP [Burkholderiales bacterium]
MTPLNSSGRHSALRRLAGASIIAAATLVALPASAQTKLKWAHVYEANEPFHTEAVWAADEIRKRTGGRYDIQVFPASQLGKESDINQGLALGTVDIIYTGQNFAARAFGPLSIGGAAFMFRDYDHWAKYVASPVFSELAAGYQKGSGGNRITAVTYYGIRHTSSNKPINKPEDMKGLKIRVPDAPLYTMFPKAVGANATPIAFAEVYLALQNGTVDAQENPLPTIEAKKFYEVQKYIVLTGHITEMLVTVVSGGTWNKLNEADRKVFETVMREAGERATKSIVDNENRLVTGFEKMGKTVIKVDRKPFQAAVAKELTAPNLPWSKELFDRVQAIK